MDFISKHAQKTYKKNMDALSKHYPALHVRLTAAAACGWKLTKTATKGVYNAYSTHKNKYYYADDPLQDVQRQLGDLGLKNARVAVFLGLGLGYEVVYYVKNMLSAQRTVFLLIVERDLDLFRLALQVTDLTELIQNPGVTLFVDLPPEELYSVLRSYILANNKFYFLKTFKPVYLASALTLDKDYYVEVLQQITQAGKDVMLDFGNSPEDSLMGIENMLDNLANIITNPGISLLYGEFKNRPAVIAATGPSLNKNKHLLKKLADKALIICPDASLKILLEAGVKPHLVTSLERTPGTLRFVQGIPKEEVEQVYFAACPVVNRKTYDAYLGPKIIVYRQLCHFKWLDIERGTLEIRKSSGNMAFKVAEALGCNPIILIGQDLAYSRDGRTHAAGTLDKDGRVRDTQQYYDPAQAIEVMGNDGQPIMTHPMWYSFLKAYEYDLTRYDGLCINSTEGGAFIPGTTVMPFSEAIDQYMTESFHPLARIKECIEEFTAEDAAAEFCKVEILLRGAIDDLEAVIQACQAGKQKIFVRQKGFEAYFTCEQLTLEQQRELSETEQEVIHCRRLVMKSCPGYDLLLLHVIQSYLVKFEIDYNAARDKYRLEHHACIDNLLQCVSWFDTIEKLTQVCLIYLRRALSNMMLKGEGHGQSIHEN